MLNTNLFVFLEYIKPFKIFNLVQFCLFVLVLFFSSSIQQRHRPVLRQIFRAVRRKTSTNSIALVPTVYLCCTVRTTMLIGKLFKDKTGFNHSTLQNIMSLDGFYEDWLRLASKRVVSRRQLWAEG